MPALALMDGINASVKFANIVLGIGVTIDQETNLRWTNLDDRIPNPGEQPIYVRIILVRERICWPLERSRGRQLKPHAVPKPREQARRFARRQGAMKAECIGQKCCASRPRYVGKFLRENFLDHSHPAVTVPDRAK